MDRKDKNYLKILVLGDIGVGKSSLINQYIYRFFPLSPYVTAIPADFYTRDITVDSQQVTLQLWEPNGAERFRPVHAGLYRQAHCCILMYDVTDPKTFDNLQSWKDEALSRSQSAQSMELQFVLIGNKVDVDHEPQVSADQMREFCERNNNMTYLDVSVKEGVNIDKAFEQAAQLALSYKEAVVLSRRGSNLIDVRHENKGRNNCCS